jgi:hypothetical protein
VVAVEVEMSEGQSVPPYHSELSMHVLTRGLIVISIDSYHQCIGARHQALKEA